MCGRTCAARASRAAAARGAPARRHRLAVPGAGRARRPARRRRRLGRLELRGRLAAQLPRDHRLHHRDLARRGARCCSGPNWSAAPQRIDRLGALDPAARRRLSRAFRRAGQPAGDLQHRADHARHGRRLHAAAARRNAWRPPCAPATGWPTSRTTTAAGASSSTTTCRTSTTRAPPGRCWPPG